MACEAGPATTGQTGPTELVRVNRIYDGDTFRVEQDDGPELDVRLVGLNAPEDGECFHDEAVERATIELEGREVGLTEMSIDQYGRTLAHVWIGSRHVNLDLVASGFAIATTPQDGDPHGKRMLTAEKEAAEAGLGLWGRDVCGASGAIPSLTIEVTNHDPQGPDNERLQDEVVAVVNQDETDVDLGGWVLRDESSRHRYRFPDGASLGAGERMIVSSADPHWDPGASPVWNNDGDLALLLDQDGRVVSFERY